MKLIGNIRTYNIIVLSSVESNKPIHMGRLLSMTLLIMPNKIGDN